MSEIDLTDYVAIGAKAFVDDQTIYAWEKLSDYNKHQFLEMVAPIVTAVISEYHKNHAAEDMSFLGGIG